MSDMTQSKVNHSIDYKNRPVAIQVTGVRRQDVMRTSNYTLKVPYSSMSRAIQQIHRMGGKIVSVRVGSSTEKQDTTAPADVLFPQLKHKNPRLRDRAMLQIAEERTAETIGQLMAILGDEDVVYRRSAVQTLGVIGPDAVPVLAEQLQNNDRSIVRASCAKALAAIALNFPEAPLPQTALDALEKGLYDADPVVKLASIGALSTVGAPALDILISALDTDDIALSVAAIGALGSIGDPKAVEALSAAATQEDADPYIRESVQSALSRLEQLNQMSETAASKRSQ